MEMAIFNISPTFEETEFRGPHGSFDGIFRILASSGVQKASPCEFKSPKSLF
jgi:hypothetical protein